MTDSNLSRARRAARRKAGCCIQCGMPSKPNRARCQKCLELINQRSRNYRDDKCKGASHPKATAVVAGAWYLTFNAGCPTVKNLYNGRGEVE